MRRLDPARAQDRVEPPGLLLRGGVHPLPGETDCGAARLERVGVPVAIALERFAVAVELVTIELNDQPLGREQRVDSMAGDPDVAIGAREPEPLAEREHVGQVRHSKVP